MSKKVLIAGCSFSMDTGWVENINNSVWIGYSNMLKELSKDKLEVDIIAEPSSGNGKIQQKLIDKLLNNNFNYDLVIVQWSAIARGLFRNTNDLMESDADTIQDMSNFISTLYDYTTKSNLEHHYVSDIVHRVENSYYIKSLTDMLGTKLLLEKKNIPHLMYWGWQQIPEDESNLIIDKLSDMLYDDNFWRFKNHGGMSEYIVNNIGEADGIVPKDFHPSTKGQELFYNEIIRNKIKHYLNIDLDECNITKNYE